jgi:hypothetical protein
MGNEQNRFFQEIVEEIKYELGITIFEDNRYFYIDKKWYENFCMYVNKE